MSTISCRALAKSFGGVEVLRGLDLEVPDGAVVTVLGESGSGKTTLLRLIAGFERPDSGSMAIDATVVDSQGVFVPPERRRIGYVAQEGNLFPHLTVARNVAFGLGRHGSDRSQVDELLELVDLSGFGGRYPHELSGGQQQRVALARALAPHPAVVLLDEPFSSLDASLRSSLRFDVMRILREQRATTVFVTHDQSEALSVADLVGIIDEGRIRQFATPETLYTHPADAVVAQFLGEANIVAGTAGQGEVTTMFGTLPLADVSRGLVGPVSALVRPEQIAMRRVELPPGSGPPATGNVVHREYYGHDSMVMVEVVGRGEPLVRVRVSGRAPVGIGDAVVLSAAGDVVAWSVGPRPPTERTGPLQPAAGRR